MTEKQPKPMKFYGQRWVYQIGNSEVMVDNAYSLDGWGQERLLINGEEVQSSSGTNRSEQSYSEPWLTQVEDSQLAVWLQAKMARIDCLVQLDGTSLLPIDYFEANWEGPSLGWPDSSSWVPAPRQSHGGHFYGFVRKILSKLGSDK